MYTYIVHGRYREFPSISYVSLIQNRRLLKINVLTYFFIVHVESLILVFPYLTRLTGKGRWLLKSIP